MSSSYNGDRIDQRYARAETIIGKQINHYHAHHEVDWPIRVGVIPEEAAHYQHRGIADRLTEALNSFGTVVLRQVLSGTGGVGKTQLAAHHARALAHITDPDQRVDVLVWANASARERITSAYAQAARHLYATVPDDPEDAAPLFLAWLQDPAKNQNRRWLIVWDDLTDPATVRDLWPPHDQDNGRVLITTRRRDHSLTTQGCRLLDVEVYTPEEAHAFLTHALDKTRAPHTATELESLAHDLGYLPLALGQAVTYMVELSMGCASYLKLFHDRMRTLREVFPDWDTSTPLAATWELSLEQANNSTPHGVAQPLMGIISLLDSTGIPTQIFNTPPMLKYLTKNRTRHPRGSTTPPHKKGSHPSHKKGVLAAINRALGNLKPYSTNHGRKVDTHDVHQAISALKRFSLITVTGRPEEPDSTVKTHQLIQRATREHTASQPTLASVLATVEALSNSWLETKISAEASQQLRTNTDAFRRITTKGGSIEELLWKLGAHPLLFQYGLSLDEAGKASQATDHWHEMTCTARSMFGPRHRHTLAIRSRLANALGESGDPAKAAKELELLLADLQRVRKKDHPDILKVRSNIAFWWGEAGRPNEAATALEILNSDQLRILGATHPHTLTTKSNIAYFKRKSGLIEGIGENYEEIIFDRIRTLGPHHRDTLNARHELAVWISESGNPASGVQSLEQVLADQIRFLGEEDPDTLTTRMILARWRSEMGEFSTATAELEALLPKLERFLGEHHPHTLTTRHDLARCRSEVGDQITATKELERVLTDQVRFLGKDHPDALTSRATIAYMRRKSGYLSKAEHELETLLFDQLRVHGHEHPGTLTTRHNLAMLRGELGSPSAAISELSETLADRTRIQGPEHPQTLTTREHLATWTYISGDTVKAVELLTALVRDQKRVFGSEHPNTQIFERALQIWQNKLPEE